MANFEITVAQSDNGFLALVADYGKGSPVGRGITKGAALGSLLALLIREGDDAVADVILLMLDEEMALVRNLYSLDYLRGMQAFTGTLIGSLT